MSGLMYFQMGVSLVSTLVILIFIDYFLRKYLPVLSMELTEKDSENVISTYKTIRWFVFAVILFGVGVYMFKSLSLNASVFRTSPDRSAVDQQAKEFEQKHKEISK